MRILRSVILILLVSAGFACALATLAWTFLPYGVFQRESVPERFVLWEGVMWAVGLACVFFGSAAFFGSTDLYTDRTVEHVQQTVRDGVRGRLEFSDLPRVPWIMLGCGLSSLLVAVAARSVVLG